VTAKLQFYGWDLSRTTLTKIELGERTLADCELLAITDVLGISLDALAAKADRAHIRRVLRGLRR
jgi:transcriptional regulator with XRE-family HTH domain